MYVVDLRCYKIYPKILVFSYFAVIFWNLQDANWVDMEAYESADTFKSNK